MNERIKELAEQAGLNATLLFNKEKLEKFSELIVKECIEVVKQDMYSGMGDHSDYSLGSDHTLQMAIGGIKEHFGVE